MPRFIATLRAGYDADDVVQAHVIADQIRLNGSQDLEIEEGDDFLDVTQVTDNGLELEPREVIDHLESTRNLLIRTRIKDCFEMARELDRLRFALKNREEPGSMLSAYDYGEFMDIATSILREGKNPHG